MRWNGIVGFTLAVLLVSPATAQAMLVHSSEDAQVILSLTDSFTPSPWSTESGYANRVARKLAFGVENAVLGWTDLFTEPKDAFDAGENVLTGIGFGLKDLLENTLGGAIHIATFPVTAVDAPLPEGGVQFP